MEDRDTKPFESVQVALSLFEKRDCQNSSSCSENGEREVGFLLKELANCKVQLEINESASKQTTLKLEVYHRTVDDLSTQLKVSNAELDKYKEECQQAQTRIAQLQSENNAIAKLLLESGVDQQVSLMFADELKSSKEELVAAAEESKVMAEELSQKSLGLISVVDESVLPSAVAVVEAEEEKSASFLGMVAELHNATEAPSQCYFDLADDLETELLAKMIQVHYFHSVLAQAKELSHEVSERASSHLALMEAEKEKMQEELRSGSGKANGLHCQIVAFSSKMQTVQHEMSEMKGRELELEVEIAILKADLHESRSRIAAESSEAKRREDMLKEELEAANSEIGDLRLNLEDATKRTELAEKAKAAVEDQLRKWREEQQHRRTCADSLAQQSTRKDTCSDKANAPPVAFQGGTSSPGLEHSKCSVVRVPLAKILNMKL